MNGRVSIEFGKKIAVPKSYSSLNNVALTFAVETQKKSGDKRMLATKEY